MYVYRYVAMYLSSFTLLSSQIAAACDFYMYISHIKKGIIKLDGK